MSGRDEQPATVPPPAGEDDAYSAATKVGAMPAEVMAKLRAEGLLPDEEPERSVRPAPAAGAPAPAIPRPAATPRVQIPSVRDSLPDMSDPDDTDERTVLSQSANALAQSPPYGYVQQRYSQPPQEPSYTRPPQAYAHAPQEQAYAQAPSVYSTQPPAPTPVETPIAFASGPSWPQPGGGAPAFPAPHHPSFMPSSPIAFSDAGVTQEIRAFGGRRSRRSTVVMVVVGILVLLLVAFAMALLSHRR